MCASDRTSSLSYDRHILDGARAPSACIPCHRADKDGTAHFRHGWYAYADKPRSRPKPLPLPRIFQPELSASFRFAIMPDRATARRDYTGIFHVWYGQCREQQTGMEWHMLKRLYSYLSECTSRSSEFLTRVIHSFQSEMTSGEMDARQFQFMILLLRNYQTYPPSRS